jgi:hypothetical protein
MANIAKSDRGSQLQIATIVVWPVVFVPDRAINVSVADISRLTSLSHNFNTISLLPIALINPDGVNNQKL